jgi:hypothetical protein
VSPVLRRALPFLVLAVAGLALAWPVLSWPMTYDDLHLVRAYSRTEILGGFAGRWDPDDMENPGLRPLFLLFNHARYAVFGEAVAAHRVFLVLLFAAYLALLVEPLERIGIPRTDSVVAAVLCLWSRFSVYHYAFLTDGAHLAQGLCVALALRALLRAIERGRVRDVALGLAWVLVGMLIREDTIAAVPVLLLLALVAAWPRGKAALRVAVAAALGAAAVCGVVMVCRLAFVEHLPQNHYSLASLLRGVTNAMSLSGRESFDPWSRLTERSWRWLPALPVLAALAGRGAQRWRPLLMLACAVLACSTALVLTRDNLFLFPVTFMGIAVAASLGVFARAGRAGLAAAAVLLLWIAVGEFRHSREFQLVFHPYSATALRWSGEFVYGSYWQATVPASRRAEIMARLASIGVDDEEQFKDKLPRKTYTATVHGPWSPIPTEPRLFAPRLAFRAFRP